MVYNEYDFEFNPLKSEKNRIKHGIDFIQAQMIWEGPVARFEAGYLYEARELVVGKIGSDFWTAVVTERKEKIRIISVRRSREKEKKLYYSYFWTNDS